MLNLDPAIFYWVLLPIAIVMFLQGCLREWITIYLRKPPTSELSQLKKTSAIARSSLLRHHGHNLTTASYNIRRSSYLSNLLVNTETNEAEMPDPMSMMQGMKGQFAIIVPNMLTLGWVNFFFSGFIVAKLPFPLPSTFKNMLQRGINLNSLPTSYISSLSWYFLLFFGLKGILNMFLGSQDSDETKLLQQQMQNQMGQMNMGSKLASMIETEHTELEINEPLCIVNNSNFKWCL